MRANLFMLPESFVYNGVDSLDTIKNKLCSLANDMRDIVHIQKEDNVFYYSYSVLCCEIFPDITFLDAIGRYLTKDQKDVFFSIITNEANIHQYSLNELEAKTIYSATEKEVNTLIRFNASKIAVNCNDYMQFDVYEIVYDKSSWLSLRRQILGNHPGDPSFFIDECVKWFPELCFHENCKKSLNVFNKMFL